MGSIFKQIKISIHEAKIRLIRLESSWEILEKNKGSIVLKIALDFAEHTKPYSFVLAKETDRKQLKALTDLLNANNEINKLNNKSIGVVLDEDKIIGFSILNEDYFIPNFTPHFVITDEKGFVNMYEYYQKFPIKN